MARKKKAPQEEHPSGDPLSLFGLWFEAVAEEQPDGIVAVDRDGRIVLYSRQSERIFGYTSDEVIGKSLSMLLPKRMAKRHRALLDEFMQEHGMVRMMGQRSAQITGLHKSGEEVPLAITIARLEMFGGSGLLAIVRMDEVGPDKVAVDSTPHLNILMEITRRQSVAMGLMDRIRTILAREVDLSTFFKTVVEIVAETFGYSNVSLYIRDGDNLNMQHQVGYEKFFDPLPIHSGIIGRCVRTGQAIFAEDVTADPDYLDAVANVESEIAVPLHDEGKVVGAINVESRSGQKLTEADLRLMVALADQVNIGITRARLYQQVSEREERYRAITDLASDYAYSFSILPDGRFRLDWIAGAFATITGYEPDADPGSTMWEDLILKEDPQGADLWSRTLLGGQPHRAEMRIRAQSGEIKWVFDSAQPVKDADGKVTRVIGAARDITDRKRAEQALRDSEERYRLVTETVADYVFANQVGVDGTLTSLWVAGAYEQITGYTPAELGHGRIWPSMLHPDDQPVDQAALDRILANEAAEWQVRITRKDGTLRHVRVAARPMWSEKDKRVTAFYGAVIDVTDQVEADKKRKESEARYRAIAEIMSDYVFAAPVVDGKALNPDWMSGAFEIITGYTLDEFEKMGGWAGIIHPDDRYLDREAQQTVLSNRPVTVQHRIIRKDGAVRIVQIDARPIWDERSRQVIGIIGGVRDITEQASAEAALEHQMRRYAALVEALTEGIVVQDREGNIVTANPSAQAILGLPLDRMLGRSSVDSDWNAIREDGSPFPGQDHPAMVTLRTGKPQNNVIMGVHKPDGTLTWLSINSVPLFYGQQDEPYAVVASFDDITILKVAQDEIRNSLEAEQRQLEISKTLQEIGSLLTVEMSLDDVFARLFDLLNKVVDYDTVEFQLFSLEGLPTVAAHRGYNRPEDQRREAEQIIKSTLEERWGKGQSYLVISDTENDPRWVKSQEFEHLQSWMGAAMRVKGNLVGILNVGSTTPGKYTDETGEVAAAFANQAAIAIENARLVQAERRQLHVARVLQEIGSILTVELGLDEVLNRLMDLLAQVINYDSVSFNLIRHDGSAYIAAQRGYTAPAVQIPEAQKILQDTLAIRWTKPEPYMVMPDTHNDPRWIISEDFKHIRSWVGAALRVKGQLIGVLNVDNRVPNAYSDETGQTVAAFASQAAIAIENARLVEEAQERTRRLELLGRITREGTAAKDLEPLMTELAEIAAELLKADGASITFYNPRLQRVKTVAASTLMQPLTTRPRKDGEQTFTGMVYLTGKPVIINDPFDDDIEIGDELRQFIRDKTRVRAGLALPLKADGEFIGALMIGYLETRQFSSGEIEWAIQAADLIALAIAKAQSYSNLENRVAERTAELVDANEKLVALTELKDEFVANVSHELRTPIASIKLYHKLLTMRTDKQDVYLDRLTRETRRLERIIEDLLLLSRLDRGQHELLVDTVDINALVQEYVQDRQMLAEEQQVTLRFEPLPVPPATQGDRAIIGQAFSVLLTNALNYTPSTGTVTVSTLQRELEARQWVGIRVSDTGPGIPQEEQARLFQRFFRGKTGMESGKPGTGLGLAIANELVAQHGGYIQVSSTGTVGEGAQFTIWLPAVTASAEE